LREIADALRAEAGFSAPSRARLEQLAQEIDANAAALGEVLRELDTRLPSAPSAEELRGLNREASATARRSSARAASPTHSSIAIPRWCGRGTSPETAERRVKGEKHRKDAPDKGKLLWRCSLAERNESLQDFVFSALPNSQPT